MEQKEVQQKLAQLQFLEEQSKGLQRQQLELAEQLSELESAKKSLEEIKKIKKGNEVMIPLGAGVWAFGSLNDTENVLTNIGADVAVKKEIPEAKKIVDEQVEAIKVINEKISAQLDRLAQNAQKIYSEVQMEMVKKEKKG